MTGTLIIFKTRDEFHSGSFLKTKAIKFGTTLEFNMVLKVHGYIIIFCRSFWHPINISINRALITTDILLLKTDFHLDEDGFFRLILIGGIIWSRQRRSAVLVWLFCRLLGSVFPFNITDTKHCDNIIINRALPFPTILCFVTHNYNARCIYMHIKMKLSYQYRISLKEKLATVILA